MKKVIVHGGAGNLSKSDHDYAEYKRGVRAAALAGYKAFENGNALDAAVEAVCSLEDNPLFNAGTGSVLNMAGEVEADAMVMFRENVGAVGALKHTQNPIKVARLVMEKTDHAFLAGTGARKFASMYFGEYDPITEERKKKLQDIKEKFSRGETRWKKNAALFAEHGTVGAVAFDGELAAATSTGGIWLKMEGRIGDSPLVGCGTYVGKNAGVSATGMGENIIRSVFAKSVDDFALTQPLEKALQKALLLSAETGAIAIDTQGNAGYAFNTQHMAWALCDGGEVTNFEVKK